MIFVGIDVIGGFLTEINVTSPTGLQEIAEQYEKALKGINKYDLQNMQGSKDGKAILAAIALISKLDAEAGKELDTILTKVKF